MTHPFKHLRQANEDVHQPPSTLETTIIIVLFSIFLIGVVAAVVERFF